MHFDYRPVLTVLALCVACDTPSPAPVHLDELRDRARLVLEEHCGSCHLPGLATSLDAALAVYDLSAPDWAAHMSERQLRDAEARLASGLSPGGGDGTPISVGIEERAAFTAYVAEELARRTTGSAGF